MLLSIVVPVAAIAAIYFAYRGWAQLRARRSRVRSARVARLIWAAAQRTD